MTKVRARRLGAVIFTASTLIAAGNTAVGCVLDATDSLAGQEIDFGSASSAYSVDNPGSAILNLGTTYGDYQYECVLTDSSTDEFVRTGEMLQLRMPAYYIWQALHPDLSEDPAVERAKQTVATVTVAFFRDGQPVGQTEVAASEWTGEEGYWILYASTPAFAVPPGVDRLELSIAFTDAADPAAHAGIERTVVRPIPVFGGDLPDKSVLFDSDGQNLRNRVIEGGSPVAGADVTLGYTEYRADTIVDASKMDRRIGKQKTNGRFGEQINNVYGEIVHEVTAGVYFDDIQGWRAEIPMSPSRASDFTFESWRSIFETTLSIPSNATKMQVYYHVKTWLVVDYARYGNVTEQWYQQGQRILMAERWDNPEGGGSNFDLGVGEPEPNPNLARTVVFIHAETQLGQDMFLRGGIDHQAAADHGINCSNDDSTPNYRCAIPIVHRNLVNPTTVPWKTGDALLDWYGREHSQLGIGQGGLLGQGSPADWTTNVWPPAYGAQKTVAEDGYGLEPLNTYGMHYWMLDVDMDCSRAFQGADGTRWFEVKAYVSNGPGWEPDIAQSSTPYLSHNHFGKCGKVNVFDWGKATASFAELP